MNGRSHLKARAAVCVLVASSMLTLSCSSGDPSGPEWPVVITVTDVQHHIGDNPGNEGQSWFGSFKVSVAFSQAEVSVKFLYPNSLGVSGPEVDRPPQILVNGEVVGLVVSDFPDTTGCLSPEREYECDITIITDASSAVLMGDNTIEVATAPGDDFVFTALRVWLHE